MNSEQPRASRGRGCKLLSAILRKPQGLSARLVSRCNARDREIVVALGGRTSLQESSPKRKSDVGQGFVSFIVKHACLLRQWFDSSLLQSSVLENSIVTYCRTRSSGLFPQAAQRSFAHAGRLVNMPTCPLANELLCCSAANACIADDATMTYFYRRLWGVDH